MRACRGQIPSTAVEPALAAMRSGGGVAVQESATRIVKQPLGHAAARTEISRASVAFVDAIGS